MRIIGKIKKYLIVISTTVMMLILNFLGLANSVWAAELGGNIQLKYSGDCGALLKYNGIQLITAYVTYNDNGKDAPAYCLNKTLKGVGSVDAYSVSANDYVTDVGLWRRIINGYPYKTIKELGCANKYEAFAATKQAIYCYIHGNNPDLYEPIGEAGTRTLNAMKKIIANAQNSNESKLQPSISINKNELSFKLDNIDKKYVSKTYSVAANVDFKTYTISIEKVGNSELPEGIKIVNTKNKAQSTFNKGETFKVIIPVNNLKNNGNFKLNVKSEMNTKPILYGKAPSGDLQDYALTTISYEDGKSSIQDSYEKNTTQITIYKQEKNTEKPLAGVTFNLLNDKKEVINAGLKTDKNGKIEIKSIMPGKYFLQETATLDGYVRYDEDIEINVDLNEQFKVTVNNSKETKIEVEKTKKEVEVNQELGKKAIVKKLPVTGM